MIQKNSFFIVFEGLDGSGKSTQINMLSEKLKQIDKKVCITAEPTSSATGGLIRDALCGNFRSSAVELAGLFLTDRIIHNVNPVWGIKKLLDEENIVICDRYYYSSFAYQGVETDLDWIINMNLNCPDIIKPDLCIYLDINPDICKKRIDSGRTHLEIFEKNGDMMQSIRNRFLEIFKKLDKKENIKIIDADRPAELIADEIFQTISKIL